MVRSTPRLLALFAFVLLGCGGNKRNAVAVESGQSAPAAQPARDMPTPDAAGTSAAAPTMGGGAAPPAAGQRAAATAGAGTTAPAAAGAQAAGSSAGAQAAAAGQSGAAGGAAGAGPTITVEPPPADVSRWEMAGSFTSMTENNAGPGNAFTVFRPSDLGKDGVKHPIITWGNGSGTMPSSYSSLLSLWATHGFVVVAANTTDPGSGEEMLAGVDWLLEENARSGSAYFGVLDSAAIGSVGYSQGGIGAVIAAVDPRITTSIPIAGGDSKIDQITGPTFLIGFDSDTVVPPLWNMAPQYEATDVPAVYGVLGGGATHLEALGDGGRIRGYVTAWLVYQLHHDVSLSGVFYGPDCTLCKDSGWTVERKNLPGAPPKPMPSTDECLANAKLPASASAACKECLCNGCPQETIQCDDVCWNMAECMVKQCNNNPDKDIANFACSGITANAVCGEYADGIRWTTALSVHGAGCMAPGSCLEVCIP
jgi:hypothetical protein